jgi:translation initiation factor IF-3
MRFRGREVVYSNLGQEIFKQIEEALAEIAQVEERSSITNQKMHITFGVKVGK